jgi:N utilization substance protein B
MTETPKPPSDDFRRQARELALQALYQLDAQKGKNLDQIGEFLDENSDHEATKELAHRWSLDTWKDLTRIDKEIIAVTENRELSRIDMVDLSNLRLGVHQLLNCPDVPAKVAINEAIELAKNYSSAQAPNFINGVLDAIYKNFETSTDRKDQR